MEKNQLKRSLPLYLLVFYGVGTIVGAGIYVLIGVVAQKAGHQLPLAFLLAALIAGITAFTYAELSGRYPTAAGEAIFAQKAFNRRSLTQIIGWLVAFVGIVSTATMTRGFIGYLDQFIHLPPPFTISLIIISLGVIAFLGALESISFASLITVFEILGLIIIIYSGFDNLVQNNHLILPSLTPTMSWVSLTGVISGAFLAFYSFIGFEDIVNLAEETRSPESNIPKAIFYSLGFSTLLYILVSLVVVTSTTPEEFINNKAPLTLIISKQEFFPPSIISLIGLVAIINGALVQIIMSSRIIYGMAKMKVAPLFLSRVHKKTKTPHWATLFVSISALLLALGFQIEVLAEATSFVTLSIFALMNLSLLRIKLRGDATSSKTYSIIFPALGLGTCTGLLSYAVLF